MANTATNFNVDPYYDDFDQSKNFHRVLFKPGQAVQARELTQMQTILQNQIERFGNHVFEEGSSVQGGDLTVDYDSKFIKLANTSTVPMFANTTIRGLISNTEAKVYSTISAVGIDPPTLMVKVQTGDNSEVIGVLSSVASNSTSATLGTGSGLFVTSANNDYYNNMMIKTLSGTGAGQARKIKDYVGSSRRIHLESAWSVLPDTTTEYRITRKAAEFVSGETINVIANNGVAWPTSKFPNTTIASSGTPFGNTCLAGVDDGVFYTRGAFVNFDKDSAIVGKYTDKPDALLGLTITESTISSTLDTTLLDPASGSYNYAAPGADRWKIGLSLVTKTLAVGSNNASNNFIEVARFKQGQLQQATKYPVYSDIEKTLARRTFDESGNYTVNPFALTKKERSIMAMGQITAATADTIRLTSNADANDDFYNAREISMQSGAAQGNVRTISDYTGSSKLITVNSDWTNTPSSGDEYVIYDPAFWTASIGAGKAYVNGHEIEFASNALISMPRARDFVQIGNASLYSQYGNYLKIDSLQGYFNSQDHDTVYLHYVPQANVSISSGAAWKSTQMGTARIRYLQDNGTVGQGHSGRTYKAYLYNIRVSNTITGTAVASAPGSRTTLNLANTTSIPQVDDIFNGASVTVTTGSSTDTVIVGDYVGSTRQITTANNLSAVPTGSSTYTIRMNAKQIRSVTAVDDTGTPTMFTGSANVALVGHSGASPTGNTILFETNNNTLAMQLPEQAIKSVKDSGGSDDTGYRFQRVYEGVSFTSGVATISTSAATERFVGTGSSDVSDSLVQDNYIVIVTDSGTLPANSSSGFIAGNNYVLDFTTNSRVVNVPTPGGAAVGTAQLTANMNFNFTGTVFASIDVGTAAPKTKTKVAANTTHSVGTSGSGQLHITSPNKLNGSYDSLQHSDIVSLVAVYDSLDPNVSVVTGQVGVTANDITARYRLDTGQRDSFYDHGRIILKAGYPAPKGRLLVLFDRYTHSGSGYFSVDSYSGGGAATLYKNIPDYTSPVTGDKMNLRDVIDFRPRRQDGSTDDEIFTVQNAQVITPSTAITLDYSYYIGRIDKIVLSDQKGFKVITGVSAEVPRAPKDEPNSMTMWTLELPPYTFSTEDIRVRKTDNRRFTMRDIGAIAKRVDNLEYYTSLSLLERDATEMVITDGAGIERFKNGIIVDSFKGHGIGDVQNEDYFAAVDAQKNELRPPGVVGKGFLTYYGDDTSAAARTALTGELLTCQYTEELVVDQTLATRTIPVNPFNTLAWVGVMKLTPERDDTPDIYTKPDIQANIEGDADAWEALAKPHNDKLSTNWGAWETNWQGTELTGTSQFSQTRETRVGGGTNVTNETIKREVFTTTKNQSREGFIPNALVPERETHNLGERVVDVNIKPYIRPQTISVTVDGLKPNTRIYSFFDGMPVSGYVKKEGNMSNNSVAFGETIATNNKGSANLEFFIPNSNDARPEAVNYKFKTGERVFMVIDDPRKRKDVATTYAEATFVASGLKLTKETTMLTTRVPRVRRKNYAESRVVKEAATEETVIGSSTSFRADPPPSPPWQDWGDGGGYGCGCGDWDHPDCNNDHCPCGCGDGGDGGGSIICTHLFKLGWFDKNLHEWDEEFGKKLAADKPEVMVGYYSWAKTIIELMYGRGPSIMFWIKDEKTRFELQSRITQKYVYNIARPWAEQMASQMGSKDHKSNWAGKFIMKMGIPLCGWLGKRIIKSSQSKSNGKGLGCAIHRDEVQYINPSQYSQSRGWAIWGVTTIMVGAALMTTGVRAAWRDLKGVT